MPAPDKVSTVVAEWVQKAEEDLLAAKRLLRPKQGCPVSTVGFHAQQRVEKFLKALLTWRQIPFPKTHNIPELVGLLPQRLSLKLSAEEQERLTTYATVNRYPGDYPPLTYEQAKAAVQTASRVRQAIRKILPKEALGENR